MHFTITPTQWHGLALLVWLWIASLNLQEQAREALNQPQQ